MGNSYIRFDWAMKRLLRDKANFAVLEGLITTLLGEKVSIHKLLENDDYNEDKFQQQYRVDMLAKDSLGKSILIELQNHNEFAYYQRTLFGMSNLFTDYLQHGQDYNKVYSINIVYFALGHGSDYVYHGTTEFRGIHTGEILELSPFQRETFKCDTVSQLYSEYYVLRVNDFNKWSKVPLEQWIYFLNTGDIPDEANAPGLPEARERLKLDCLTKSELNAYYRHLDDVVILRDNVYTERAEGRAEGLAEGRKEGMEEGIAIGVEQNRLENAKAFKDAGVDEAFIAKTLGLSMDVIHNL